MFPPNEYLKLKTENLKMTAAAGEISPCGSKMPWLKKRRLRLRIGGRRVEVESYAFIYAIRHS